MPPEIKAPPAGSDEYRLRNYRAQLASNNEAEIREMQAQHAEEVSRIQGTYKEAHELLGHDYDVQISQEAEALDEQLQKVHLSSQSRLEEEKHSADQELTKTKRANQQRIEEYKKESELKLDSLRKQFQASAEYLHEKARKTAKKDKEV